MKSDQVEIVDDLRDFGQKLAITLGMFTVLVTTAANLAFTFAPELMSRFVQSLLI